MKTSKIVVCGVGALTVAVAAVIMWVCWSKCGGGYSEDQCRNWNEMVASTDAETYERILRNGYDHVFTSMIENRRDQPDVPTWKPEIPVTDPFSLPRQGMPVPVLKRLADQGDGKACLELVFRIGPFGTTYDSSRVGMCFFYLSSVYETEKYLKKAVETGLPGSEFLLSLFEYRKRNGDDLHVKDIDGYGAFLSLLDQGDFSVGKVYLYLDPNGEEALSRLEKGLEIKAKSGDTDALRNAAHLALMRQYSGHPHRNLISFLSAGGDRTIDSLCDRVNKGGELVSSIMPSLSRLSEKTQKEIIEWLRDREWKSIRQTLEAPVDMLGEAAQKGDLHAKYLWCRYMVLTQRSFSHKEWNRYLAYADDLLKAGGIYRGEQMSDPDPNTYELIKYFYRGENVWAVKAELGEHAKKDIARVCSQAAGYWDIRQLECEGDPSEYYFPFISRRNPVSREEELLGCKLVESAANEGDPYGMYYFATMLNDGNMIECDGRRAWDVVQRLKTWRKGIHVGVAYDFLGKDSEKDAEKGDPFMVFVSRSFSDSVNILELDIVSRHGDMPGMTVKDAFEKFLLMRAESVKKWSRIPFDKTCQPEKVKEQFEKRGVKIFEKR